MKSLFFKDKFLLIIILLFAGFLRLYKIADYMTFLGDEGRDVLKVYDILHGQPTLLGPTASVGGFFLGPIYYYFITPFLWLFSYNPVGPAVMVGLFGIATVWLTYFVGEKFFGKTVGIVASLLYAISPLVIAYSRSSWNPNLMPFFSLLSLYALYKAVEKKSTKLFVVCGILLGIALQLHYLAIFLGVIVVTYILLTKSLFTRGISFPKIFLQVFKDYLLVFLGIIIGWSPFLAFEARHGFQNLASIFSFIFHSGQTGVVSNFYATISSVFFRLFARLVTKFPPPEQVSLQAHLPIAVWYYLTLALAIVSVFLLFKQWRNSFKDKIQFQKLSLLVLWLFFGIVLFGFYKKSIYDYYFGFMFPLPFLLVGNLIVFFYKKFKSLGCLFSIAALTTLVVVNLTGIPFRSPPNRQLAQVEEISKFVLSKTDNKPFNFALITGGNSDHGYRYFFTLWGKPPITIENEKNDPQRKTVTSQLLIVCEINPCAPLGNSLWEVAGFGRAEIEDFWEVSVVKVYKLKRWKGG